MNQTLTLAQRWGYQNSNFLLIKSNFNKWLVFKKNKPSIIDQIPFLNFSTWWNTQPRINSTSESVFILTMFWGSTKCCRAQALIVCKLEWEVPSASPRWVILCHIWPLLKYYSPTLHMIKISFTTTASCE